MAQLPNVFNPSAPGQEGVGDFTAIDPGDYVAHIIKSEMKQTKNGQGQYLELMWQIVQGDNTGRNLWTRLNLVNNSIQAVEIAQKHLKSICDAVGVPGPLSDSNVLHNKPCMIRVTKKAATSEYPEGNDVKGYEPLTSAVPAVPVVAGAPVAATPQSAMAAAAASTVANPTPGVAAPAQEVPAKPPWVK